MMLIVQRVALGGRQLRLQTRLSKDDVDDEAEEEAEDAEHIRWPHSRYRRLFATL